LRLAQEPVEEAAPNRGAGAKRISPLERRARTPPHGLAGSRVLPQIPDRLAQGGGIATTHGNATALFPQYLRDLAVAVADKDDRSARRQNSV